jgi:phage terminase small subunit
MTIKEITKDLKPSKRKFVIQYVFDAETAGNSTQSFLAVRPNFNPESARREASLWLHEPEVQQAVKKLEQMKLDDDDANAIKKI